jgi:Holliday junction DNA helicase RuvA
MISRLRGLLLEKTPPALLVDVNGVGYEVFAPMSSFYALPEIGGEVTLHTHFVVREDVQQLYGFVASRDRELFRTLIKVNGVGPKLALGIMSGMESVELLRCVRSDNVKALSQIPGIGKKTAERLIIELRDKLADWDVTGAVSETTAVPVKVGDRSGEAESALVALGYKPVEATRLVSAALAGKPEANSEELIRLALRAALNG